MNKILILVFFSFLSLMVHATISDKTVAPENEQRRESLISSLYGRWEGKIEYEYFENATLKEKSSRPFAIEIAPTSIEFYDKDKTGAWVKVRRSYVNSFKFEADKNTISGHFFHSGTDEDGLWVESQTLYITLKDDNSLLLYSIRAVNNTGVNNSIPGTKWMQIGAGEFQKNNP